MDETLAPGKEIDLYELSLTLSDKPTDPPQASTLYGEGKFQLQYERVLGDSMLSSVSIKTDAALRRLATGKLDLVVSKRIRRADLDENSRFLLDLLDRLEKEATKPKMDEEEAEVLEAQLGVKKAYIQASEVAVATAKLKLDNSQRLFERKTISINELQLGKLELEAANAQPVVRTAEMKEVEAKLKFARKRVEDGKATGVRPPASHTPSGN